ncbi:MAG: DNA-formamidopyrimidine glycosylase family protein [Planctomycetota bacterium]
MPELPEVELGRKIATRVSAGRTIDRAECDDDDIVFDGVTPDEVKRTIEGRRVESVERWGKQLWFEFDRGPALLVHFGMTGAFRVPDAAPLRLESSPKELDTGWPPKFVKLLLTFDDGGVLAFTNSRRFGRIRLRDDPRGTPPVSELGFDPLTALPSPEEFDALLERRSGTLKGLLLQQSFAAGVGNWIADEVLYHAKLAPARKVTSLDRADRRRLRSKLRAVIERTVQVDADKNRLPRGWLFHRRWGKDPAARTADGEPITIETIAGRTTAWVPTVQR